MITTAEEISSSNKMTDSDTLLLPAEYNEKPGYSIRVNQGGWERGKDSGQCRDTRSGGAIQREKDGNSLQQ